MKQRVKDLLAEGFTNQEIADRTGLKVRGVKCHIAELLSERGLYGQGDSRRLVVMLVTEALAGRANEEARLTNAAANPIVSASTRGKNHHADDAAQL